MKPTSDWRRWTDRVVNLAMLWTGSLLAGSGFALNYRVGYDAPRGATVWGMDGESWGSLHWTLGLIVLALLTLHLIRHRRWLWAVLVSRMNLRLALVLLVAETVYGNRVRKSPRGGTRGAGSAEGES